MRRLEVNREKPVRGGQKAPEKGGDRVDTGTQQMKYVADTDTKCFEKQEMLQRVPHQINQAPNTVQESNKSPGQESKYFP